MSRSESFALGAVMITVALTVLTGSQKAAWFLLAVGAVLICSPYFLDWRYGKYRPSREEVGAMSADEYKKKLRNPKFERYINRLFKGRV
jgi:hypothetical protein